ncbi:MAG: hypothetical protein LWX52_17130, partial [Deltaproteobacteria bacterium]|nr:hypothetical protein [Deltaproteobacteria bacterium]
AWPYGAYPPCGCVLGPAEWYWVGHPGKDKCENGAFLEDTVRKVINIPWYLYGSMFHRTKNIRRYL